MLGICRRLLGLIWRKVGMMLSYYVFCGCKLFLAGMKMMVFVEEVLVNYVLVVVVICRV